MRWSFSQWETYNQCPAKWNFKSVQKIPSSPPGPAAARGLEMHKRVEDYILGQRDDLIPPAYSFGGKPAAKIADKYLHVINAYRDHENGDRYVEKKLYFDSDWHPCGGISENTWCVSVLDASRFIDRILNIGEWKSGSPKDTHADQRKLYALCGLRKWYADEVHVTTYYLEDTAPPQRLVVKPSAEEKLKELWQGRVETMQNDKILAPNKGDHCRWCDYAKAKGGPCKF